MTQIIKPLIPFLTLFFVISCSEPKKESQRNKDETRRENQIHLDTLNINQSEKVSKASNAITGWDTTQKFTYSLQELFETSSRPISFKGSIKDILKKDSSYILKVVSSNSQSYRTFLAEISVSLIMFQDIKLKLDPNEDNEGCFVFLVSKISSNQPILKSEIESDGNYVQDASSHLTFDFDETLVKFHGQLVSYHLYDRLKEDNE